MMRNSFFILPALLLTTILTNAQIPADSIYFGFPPPGDSAVIFAPGVISVPDRRERTPNYLPDYSEFYFSTTTSGETPHVYSTKYTDNHWESPSVHPAFPNFACDLSITDSTLACFTSNYGNSDYYNTDIWIIERINKIWGTPYKVQGNVNSSQDDWGACILKDRTLYVCKYLSGSDIFKYNPEEGDYPTGERLSINSSQSEWDPYVADDKSYIIFKSNREGGYGDMDLYISYLKENGTYTHPKNLGDKINTDIHDDCGNLTPDGKYFMFARNNRTAGEFDIYWVSSGFIDSLRYTNFTPYVSQYILNQFYPVDTYFSYTIPDTTFMDDDGLETLSYNATLSNGEDLPQWLAFDSLALTLSGMPETVENLFILISATDTAGASASDQFTLRIQNPGAIKNDKKEEIAVYPNPADNYITIVFDESIGASIHYSLINTLGETVKRGTLNASHRIDITGMDRSNYILKIHYDHHKIIRKLLIQ